MLDEQASKVILSAALKANVKVIFNTDITRVVGDKVVEKVILSNNKTLPADVVIIAKGVKPNLLSVKVNKKSP